MHTKRICLSVGLLAAVAVAREPNYDESKVAPYTLEDPLTFADGTKLTDASQWPARRAEIVRIFEREMYGRTPPKPEAVVTELREEGPTLAGLAIRRQYRMWFKTDRTGPFVDWLVVIPNRIGGMAPVVRDGRVVCENKGKVPVVLMLNYRGNQELLTDPEVFLPENVWLQNHAEKFCFAHKPTCQTAGAARQTQSASPMPIEMIVARGYALMTACYGQVSPDVEVRKGDCEDLAYTGVFELWPKRDPQATDNITALGAWAWALSRGLDFAETIPEIDATKSVATGCSRLAKTPLLACSRDERFAVCVPCQTGGGGCPLAKRDFGENVSTEMRAFPHWYCRAYGKYDDNEQAMKFDQHLLLASIAPRALLVEGFNSRWFDTKGEFLACRAASPAWTFLGKAGLPEGDFPDNFDTDRIGSSLGYVRRGGAHGISGSDWQWMLDFADKALAASVVSAETIHLECEQFADLGGWKVDSQFIDEMGSSYLLAHGLGRPVADATTSFEVRKPGTYGAWVRTKNWTAKWRKKAESAGGGGVSESAGRFQLVINGTPMPTVLGVEGKGEWLWTKVGDVVLKSGRNTVALHDLTGFDGRCDAICFTTSLTPHTSHTSQTSQTISSDLTVVGGGIAGICTAISAARLGLKVALVQDRPVLGGANSSEVRVHLGARQNIGPYPRLGDVVAEIGPKNGGNARPAENYEDERKLAAVNAETNITLFLNTRVVGVEKSKSKVEVEERRIASVVGRDVMSGKRTRFVAPLFVDCTGDGTVGFLAGADYRIGRESKAETGEERAPETADKMTMGASVQWYAEKKGTGNGEQGTGNGEQGTGFPCEPWMIAFDEANCSYGLRGDWEWETGMNSDQLNDFETVRDYGLLVAYSNWSYVKNLGKRKAEFADAALAWVAHVAGKRETRRLMGDHILTQQDVCNPRHYPDGTCCATWSIDLHFPMTAEESKFDGEPFRSVAKHTRTKPYPIPYRCLYSRNVGNLFMAGRDISVTHVALGTTRLMRTHGMMGEVVGMAASICKKHGCDPRGVYEKHFGELQKLMTRGVGTFVRQPPQEYNLGASDLCGTVLVDDGLPAGNIIFERLSNDTVFVRQDLRGVRNGDWFYWAMRVRGAAGRTLTFVYTDGLDPVGVRGPVMTLDRGKTYAYPLDGQTTRKSFTYAFGPDQNEVWFYECLPYVQRDWETFLSQHADKRGTAFETGVLCKSRKGRDVEKAVFGCLKNPKHTLLITSRHHASEAVATYVLEGFLAATLGDDELGDWFRRNVAVMTVPFVDKDGSEEGDQGKSRYPHDHNRDYTEFIYPETRAITQWIRDFTGNRLDVWLDIHCPWIRDDYAIYTPHKRDVNGHNAAAAVRFNALLEKLQEGDLCYRAADDLPYGKDWNKGLNYEQGLSAIYWALGALPELKLGHTFEIPFATANGKVVTPEKCRAFGRGLARVAQEFLREVPSGRHRRRLSASGDVE